MDNKSLEKESILVVDDDLGFMESLQMLLTPFYDVHTAGNGKEALSCILSKGIDFVILDLNLPGISGIDILREIKKLKPEIGVIISTAYGTLKIAQEIIYLGADGFISKPYKAADIIILLRKCLERRTFDLKIRSIAQKMHRFKSINIFAADNE